MGDRYLENLREVWGGSSGEYEGTLGYIPPHGPPPPSRKDPITKAAKSTSSQISTSYVGCCRHLG